jgi:hypothetical protein
LTAIDTSGNMRLVSNRILASSTFIGSIVWLAALVVMPSSPIARVLLLAPLVIVPRLLHRIDWPPVSRLGGWLAVAAALPLVVAFALPAGPLAAALTGPWILLTTVALVIAVRHGVRRLPGLISWHGVADLGTCVALGFLAVGATFLVTVRLGVRPLGFSEVIILLTAVHFHFAGFALLAIASSLGRTVRPMRAPAVGLVVGMPITALGFVSGSLLIAALGAVVVGGSGLAIGLGLLAAASRRARTLAERLAWRAAGVALLVAMPLGIGWSLAPLIGGALLPLDTMVRTHGFLNALAVTLVAMADGGLDA